MLVLSVIVCGCASQHPAFLREPLPDNADFARVSADIAAHAERRVRWGGSVVRVENQAQRSVLEIVERPLNSEGRPQSLHSNGRFLAHVAGFLDPLVYTQGREVTVMGTVAGSEVAKIGDYEYRYPVIRVEQLYLWNVQVPLPPSYRDPYWYDPWYPWYPWWRRPYW